MTGLFKFLNSQHLDYMVRDGTIRMSTLSHFRALEGDKWIADPNEATTIVNIETETPHGNEGPEPYGEPWRPAGYPACVQVSGGAKLIFKNVQFAYPHPDCFIFCMSCGLLEALTQSMCRDAEQPYDACVHKQVPPDLLAHRILSPGRIVELHGEPVRRYFSRVNAKLVTYDWIAYHASTGPA